jgi:adenylate cyclase
MIGLGWLTRGWRPAGAAAVAPGRQRLGLYVRFGVGTVAALLGLLAIARVPGNIAQIVDPIELRIRDWYVLLRGRLSPPPGITIVAIDESSLERIGHWPWPRTRTAELVARLQAGGARAIGLDILLTEPDRSSSLYLAQALAHAYRELGLDRRSGPPARFGRRLEEALAETDTDGTMAEVMTATRRVILPYAFIFPPEASPALDDDGWRRLNRSAIVTFAERAAQGAIEPREATGVILPLERFHRAAAGAGHANVIPDLDGALRRTPLVVRFGAGTFPSLIVEVARVGLGLRRTDVRLTADQSLQIGKHRVPLDHQGFMHLTYYGPRKTFPQRSAADVLLASEPPAVDGQIVLVGFTALGLMDVRATPFDTEMPGVETHATALANVMEDRSLWRHDALRLPEALAVLLLAAASPLLLPRLGGLRGSAVALALAVTVVAVGLAAFRHGVWIEVLPAVTALAVAHVGTVTYQVLTEERERRWIKRAFQQYVPAEVVDAVALNPAALAFGGQRRTMTVMFSDIRSYTTFAERHRPEEVVAVLHEYLTAMVEVVFRHRGTLDKFIGDAIMALFGAPLTDEDHALNACRAAIEMSETLDRLNAQWRAGGRETLSAGIGISSGEMVVGNLGSSQRFAYTVTGDQVNLAARLEGLTKDYPTTRSIIISEGTYALVRERVTARPLGSVTVKGKMQAVEIYELLEVQR